MGIVGPFIQDMATLGVLGMATTMGIGTVGLMFRTTCRRCGTTEVERPAGRKPTHCYKCGAQLTECVPVEKKEAPKPPTVTPEVIQAATPSEQPMPVKVDQEAQAMLQRKLVNGDITPEQYKETLKILRGET